MNPIELEIKTSTNQLIVKVKNHSFNEVSIKWICFSVKDPLLDNYNDIAKIKPSINLPSMKEFICEFDLMDIIKNFDLKTKFLIKICHSNNQIHCSKSFYIKDLINI